MGSGEWYLPLISWFRCGGRAQQAANRHHRAAEQADERFRLRRGTHGDSQVADELRRGAERIAFYDVRFHGRCRASNLIEQVAGLGMECGVRGAMCDEGGPVCSLPGLEGLVLVHAEGWGTRARQVSPFQCAPHRSLAPVGTTPYSPLPTHYLRHYPCTAAPPCSPATPAS